MIFTAGNPVVPSLGQDAMANNTLLVPAAVEERSAGAAQDIHRLFPALVDHGNAAGLKGGAQGVKQSQGGKASQDAAANVKEERFSQSMLACAAPSVCVP